MKYYMVTDVQNDEIYYTRAKDEKQAKMKARNFWNEEEPYTERIFINVKEVSEKEYKKYVSR